jgi:hypothetical protein
MINVMIYQDSTFQIPIHYHLFNSRFAFPCNHIPTKLVLLIRQGWFLIGCIRRANLIMSQLYCMFYNKNIINYKNKQKSEEKKIPSRLPNSCSSVESGPMGLAPEAADSSFDSLGGGSLESESSPRTMCLRILLDRRSMFQVIWLVCLVCLGVGKNED